MEKTVLDLTPEELRVFHPGRKVRRPVEVEERWTRAWSEARVAANVLRERFGAARVVAFGSVANKGSFGPWSDIDLAVWGVPPERFYKAVAAVTAISSEFEIDLVDGETCPPKLRARLAREGIEA
jgi:predicted nucleotidyltransferase